MGILCCAKGQIINACGLENCVAHEMHVDCCQIASLLLQPAQFADIFNDSM